jgi:hypothetical protein
MEFKDPNIPLSDIPKKYRGAFGRWRKIKTTPIKERFWPKVDIKSPEECWNYMGPYEKHGYGIVTLFAKPRVRWLAHRLAWTLSNGEIKDGLDVCHKCDNPPCCNPNHLFTGTALDNVRDCISKGRARKAQGEKHASAKVTARQVIQIRSMKGTATCREIGKLFGLTKSGVQHIMSGLKWKHIPW